MHAKICFIDVDTQEDHLSPGGRRCVRRADEILPALQLLTEYASKQRIPIISTVCAYEERFQFAPGITPHCIAGTAGANKVPQTLTADFVTVPNEPYSQTIHFETQIILPKPDLDPFSHQAARTILEAMPTRRCVVYGVSTELNVKSTVNRLLLCGYQIEVVRNAIAPYVESEEVAALNEISQLGAKFTTLEKVLK